MSVINFPQNPVENQTYENGGRVWVYKNGAWRLYSAVNGMNPVSLVLPRYDLDTAVTVGPCDLNTCQVFTIDNSTAAVKTVTFSNTPANKAMTVVLKVIGKVGTLSLPAGIKTAKDVAVEYGTTRTIITLFWDGSAMTVINYIVVN